MCHTPTFIISSLPQSLAPSHISWLSFRSAALRQCNTMQAEAITDDCCIWPLNKTLFRLFWECFSLHWDNAIQCKQRPLQMTVVFGLWIKFCLDYFENVFPYIYYCLFVCVSLHLSIYHNFLLFYFFFLLRIVWIITYWFSTYTYIVLLLLFILFIMCTRLQSLIYNLCDTVLIHWYQYQFGKQSSVSVRLYLYLLVYW